MGMILENEVFKRLKFSKNFINKKHAPNMIFCNEKNREIQIIFDIEKWIWKSEIGAFR